MYDVLANAITSTYRNNNDNLPWHKVTEQVALHRPIFQSRQQHYPAHAITHADDLSSEIDVCFHNTLLNYTAQNWYPMAPIFHLSKIQNGTNKEEKKSSDGGEKEGANHLSRLY